MNDRLRPTWSGPNRWTFLNLALGLLVLVLVVVSGAVLVRGQDTPVLSDMLRPNPTAMERQSLAYTEASTAARSWSLKFLKVDYKDMDPLIADVLASSTDPFRSQYDRAKVDLKALVQDMLSVSTGRVLSVGVGEMGQDKAVAFVAADSAATNKSTRKKTNREYRLKLTMLRKGGHWLTSKVEFVP